jgi:UDP-2,4-diacetamido-2,4,6-trideoxy-beta-L-altropyranose hydrolase
MKTIWRWPKLVIHSRMQSDQLKGRSIAARVDASSLIGLGHFMRCLALADAARAHGANTLFIARNLPNSCLSLLVASGHEHVDIETPCVDRPAIDEVTSCYAHSHWLPVSQQRDASDCLRAIEGFVPDWLIVDHYALDAVWEEALAPHCKRLMVIDDLADRPHACDLLLDQNLGRRAEDYKPYLKRSEEMMIGPQFSLLRPEFATYRNRSLVKRDTQKLNCVLVAMGGADNDNVTGDVLTALLSANIPSDIQFKIVLGAQTKWAEQVRDLAGRLGDRASVYIGVSNMAELMAECALAIGAAGGSAWERCCLGLPTILIVLAENQRAGATALHTAGAAITSNDVLEIPELIESLLRDNGPGSAVQRMSLSARQLVDGLGLERVLRRMFGDATL